MSDSSSNSSSGGIGFVGRHRLCRAAHHRVHRLKAHRLHTVDVAVGAVTYLDFDCACCRRAAHLRTRRADSDSNQTESKARAQTNLTLHTSARSALPPN